MKKIIVVLAVLAIASPSPSWAEESAEQFLQRLPPPNPNAWPTPPLSKDERLGRPSQRMVGQCFTPGYVNLEGKKVPDDPFENEEGFSCMLRRDFRYCRDCQSRGRRCSDHRWAPYDKRCWKGTPYTGK